MRQFRMDHLIDDIAQDLQYAAICYGPTLQGGPNGDDLADVFKFASLRATWVHPNWIDDVDNFSPIRDDWENVTATHLMTVFTPHDVPCDPDRICPPCN